MELLVAAGPLAVLMATLHVGCKQVDIDEKPSTTIDSTQNGCCATTYWAHVDVDANGGNKFYFLMLVVPPDLDIGKYGPYKRALANGNEKLNLSLTVDYADNLIPSEYILRVGVANEWSGVGKLSELALQGGDSVVTVPDYSDSNCTACCTPGNRYSVLRKPQPNCTGVSARIKARYGLPCDYPASDELSRGVSWVGIERVVDNPQGPILYWGQTGVGWERFPALHGGSNQVFRLVYWEVRSTEGDPRQQFFYDYSSGGTVPPSDGIAQMYSCLLDHTSSRWTITIGGYEFYWSLDSFWLSNMADQATWCGEIYHAQDDMPGTEGNRCGFGGLKMGVNGSTLVTVSDDAGDQVHSDNYAEWNVRRVTADSIEIWDMKPNL